MEGALVGTHLGFCRKSRGDYFQQLGGKTSGGTLYSTGRFWRKWIFFLAICYCFIITEKEGLGVEDISARGQPTKNETYIGLGILLALAGIVIGVFLKQFHYNPAILVPRSPKAGNSATSIVDLAGDTLTDLAEGMVPLSPPEIFGPENLSDKINGKAELYLSAGFLSLLTQRLAEKGDPGSWMEVFVYDMGNVRRSFAVYSVQRRPDAENVSLTDFAYRTENALFFAHGRYYVEMIASVTTGKMEEALRSFAHRFIEKTGAHGERIDELTLFPREHLDKDSIMLLISDAFGFDRLNNVFMANYTVGNTELTAFLSLREDSSEASELVAAYHGFLIENGGVDVKSEITIPGAKLVEILDTFELIFSHGKFLAGVHAAEDKGEAEKFAGTLMRTLSGGST
ncbi:MAG: hypothetical protein GTO13_16075 [Proteobacteria bacterium]|nr:hypothetical protein [Pseudomonadota bacterium]